MSHVCLLRPVSVLLLSMTERVHCVHGPYSLCVCMPEHIPPHPPGGGVAQVGFSAILCSFAALGCSFTCLPVCLWAPFSVFPSLGYPSFLWSCPALWFGFVVQQLYIISHVLHPWLVFVSVLRGGTWLWCAGSGSCYVARDRFNLPVATSAKLILT